MKLHGMAKHTNEIREGGPGNYLENYNKNQKTQFIKGAFFGGFFGAFGTVIAREISKYLKNRGKNEKKWWKTLGKSKKKQNSFDKNELLPFL